MVSIILVALFSSLAIIVAVSRQKKSQRSLNTPNRLKHLTELGVSFTVAEFILQGDRLHAVKSYRDESGLGLREATAYVDEMSKMSL